MLVDVHSAKKSIPVVAGPGDTIVIAAVPGAWIYVHNLMGDLNVNGTLTVKCGTVSQAAFDLDAGQGITEGDEPGNDGVPRFKCKPGDDFVLNLSSLSTFKGTCDYSLRY